MDIRTLSSHEDLDSKDRIAELAIQFALFCKKATKWKKQWLNWVGIFPPICAQSELTFWKSQLNHLYGEKVLIVTKPLGSGKSTIASA